VSRYYCSPGVQQYVTICVLRLTLTSALVLKQHVHKHIWTADPRCHGEDTVGVAAGKLQHMVSYDGSPVEAVVMHEELARRLVTISNG
jgi:hypothetical protein